MTQGELQTLLDINTSHSFSELQYKSAVRLTALQQANQLQEKKKLIVGSLAELKVQSDIPK